MTGKHLEHAIMHDDFVLVKTSYDHVYMYLGAHVSVVSFEDGPKLILEIKEETISLSSDESSPSSLYVSAECINKIKSVISTCDQCPHSCVQIRNDLDLILY